MTAVRANLGERRRTGGPTQARLAYSSERPRTMANTRSAVSKTAACGGTANWRQKGRIGASELGQTRAAAQHYNAYALSLTASHHKGLVVAGTSGCQESGIMGLSRVGGPIYTDFEFSTGSSLLGAKGSRVQIPPPRPTALRSRW